VRGGSPFGRGGFAPESSGARGAFRDVGFLVVDEIHTVATETLSKCLFYITPRYLIGLSATPTRSDGMDILLDVYFGDVKITKKLYRPHTVYRINTNLEPELKYSNSGTVDWSSVIDFQSNTVERNDMIVDITQQLPDRYILILCKRISQAEYLVGKLEKLGDKVTSLVGSNTQYDRSARVMVATVQKCGVGFDWDKLNTLILATDVQEYFVQYLGRVMRTPQGNPIVFDLVDDNNILNRHFSIRKKVYKETGGHIIKIEKSDLNKISL
jgi:superfamily II DNA or RNA helicase